MAVKRRVKKPVYPVLVDTKTEAWNVVGGWINAMAEHRRDPAGGPWLPRIDDVRVAVEAVEQSLIRISPPT